MHVGESACIVEFDFDMFVIDVLVALDCADDDVVEEGIVIAVDFSQDDVAFVVFSVAIDEVLSVFDGIECAQFID